jgi:hypothetical protein
MEVKKSGASYHIGNQNKQLISGFCSLFEVFLPDHGSGEYHLALT